MAEATLFTLIVAGLAVAVLYALKLTSVHPLWVFVPVAFLLLPGFWAAFTSGPFVPSARKRHKIMLRLARLKAGDTVYDLGCGDGRLVFEAAETSKKAIGYELSIPLYLYGKAKRFVLRLKGEIRFGNIWKQDYADADVIFCYLLPNAMQRFHTEIWPRLKPGTRVISNAFPIHALKPEEQEDKVFVYRR